MYREDLLKRKSVLQQQRDQFVANANAVAGALQEIEFWISELDRPDVKTEELGRSNLARTAAEA